MNRTHFSPASPRYMLPKQAAIALLMLPLALGLAGHSFGAPPAPYPITVNSQSATAPAIDAYQAVAKTWRVTYKDGTNSINVTNCTPFMVRSTNAVPSGGYFTSSWSVVNYTSGIVDFTFAASALNATGVFAYEVGIIDTGTVAGMYRAGSLRLIPSVYGSSTPTSAITDTLNFSLYTLLNVPAAWTSAYATATNAIISLYGTNGVVASYTTGGGATVSVHDAYFAATYATGTPLYVETYTGSVGSLAGYATGSPLYVETYTGSVGSLDGVLPTSTWASADSTTNYVRRTGDTMISPLTATVVYASRFLGTNNGTVLIAQTQTMVYSENSIAGLWYAGWQSIGSTNLFLGPEAGLSSVGQKNSLIGDKAGWQFTGTNSHFMGSGAGRTAKQLDRCSGLGLDALYGASNVSQTISVGGNAGSYVRDSIGATLLGWWAGAYRTNVDYKTIINGSNVVMEGIVEFEKEAVHGANVNMGGHSISNIGGGGGSLTGTPLYAESDPIWAAASGGVRYAATLITSQDIDWTSAPFDELADGDDTGVGAGVVLTVEVQSAASTWDAATGTLALNTNDAAGSGSVTNEAVETITADNIAAWSQATIDATNALDYAVAGSNLAAAVRADFDGASNSWALVGHTHRTNAFAPTAVVLDAGATATIMRTGASWFSVDSTSNATYTLAIATASWATNEGGICRVDLIGTGVISFAAASFHASGFNSSTNVTVSALWPTTLILSKPWASTSLLWRVSQVIP